jgi:hypothetical protein
MVCHIDPNLSGDISEKTIAMVTAKSLGYTRERRPSAMGRGGVSRTLTGNIPGRGGFCPGILDLLAYTDLTAANATASAVQKTRCVGELTMELCKRHAVAALVFEGGCQWIRLKILRSLERYSFLAACL